MHCRSQQAMFLTSLSNAMLLTKRGRVNATRARHGAGAVVDPVSCSHCCTHTCCLGSATVPLGKQQQWMALGRQETHTQVQQLLLHARARTHKLIFKFVFKVPAFACWVHFLFWCKSEACLLCSFGENTCLSCWKSRGRYIQCDLFGNFEVRTEHPTKHSSLGDIHCWLLSSLVSTAI